MTVIIWIVLGIKPLHNVLLLGMKPLQDVLLLFIVKKLNEFKTTEFELYLYPNQSTDMKQQDCWDKYLTHH